MHKTRGEGCDALPHTERQGNRQHRAITITTVTQTDSLHQPPFCGRPQCQNPVTLWLFSVESLVWTSTTGGSSVLLAKLKEHYHESTEPTVLVPKNRNITLLGQR
jgi:hypothetical protein